MYKQSGNFLIQALMALTLMFAFVPMVVGRIAGHDMDSKMYATTNKIETVSSAARIYIRENADDLNYGQTVLSGNNFIDTLEPYGLPLGFIPKTAFNQDMRIIIEKNTTETFGVLEISGGNMNGIKRAELIRRIGFYGFEDNDNIYVGIPLNDVYSDIVHRNETNLDNSRFLNDLDMGNFSISNSIGILANTAEFGTTQTDVLSITGIESNKKSKNSISNLITERSVFRNDTGETALSVTRGTLNAQNANAQTISIYGSTGNIYSNSASVYDFALTAGSTSFNGPLNWNIHGNVITDRVNFVVDTLEIASTLNVTSGQDAYVDETAGEIVFSSNTGIDTEYLSAANVTLRDQTSRGITKGGTGAILLDIRPSGTSLLPDAQIEAINNDEFAILSNPLGEDADTTECKTIIQNIGFNYNAHSLAQYIVCQYVFWNRLEQRVNAKQCLMVGGNGC